MKLHRIMIGLGMLGVIDAVLLFDTEWGIRQNINQKLLSRDEGVWTFGQTLALLLLLVPLRDLGEALWERRAKVLGERLLDASLKGELQVVKHVLGLGPQKDAIDSSMVVAMENNQLDVVKYLFDLGAKISDKDRDALLCPVAQQGHLEIIKFLVEHGANVNAKGEKKILGLFVLADFLQGRKDETPIHKSAEQGHYEIVKFLVEHGADVNAKGKDNETPVHLSAQHGHHEIVKFLVEHGADVNAKGRNNKTLLPWGIQNGNYQIVKLLVEHGADVNAK
ncbi:hypothetical protein H0H87_009772, partial [Tephrocybe sp. NHM501043]